MSTAARIGADWVRRPLARCPSSVHGPWRQVRPWRQSAWTVQCLRAAVLVPERRVPCGSFVVRIRLVSRSRHRAGVVVLGRPVSGGASDGVYGGVVEVEHVGPAAQASSSAGRSARRAAMSSPCSLSVLSATKLARRGANLVLVAPPGPPGESGRRTHPRPRRHGHRRRITAQPTDAQRHRFRTSLATRGHDRTAPWGSFWPCPMSVASGTMPSSETAVSGAIHGNVGNWPVRERPRRRLRR